MKEFVGKLVNVTSANDRIRYYDFKFDVNCGFHFKPGQFVSVMKPSEPRPIPRPYSIASTPQENIDGLLKLVVTVVPGGKVSPWLHALEEGASVTFKGPFGSFTMSDSDPKEIHFISVGTGIAPFRSMILDLYGKNADKQIFLYHGNRHEDSILYDDDFQRLKSQHDTFHYFPSVSRPSESWTGLKGYVQNVVKENVGQAGNKKVYICGITAMIDDVCQILSDKGFDKEDIHFERYD